MTSGSSLVANVFEHSHRVKYVHYALVDQLGENILTKGIRERTRLLSECLANGECPVLVHCNAGLSRSATVLIAWLMAAHSLTLSSAIERVSACRGRPLHINPSFWMALAAWERELRGWPPRTPPSFNFRPAWVEHFEAMGCARDQIERAVRDEGDWVDFDRAFNVLFG
uniref:Uncharacterized protein n=1 Tax=Coccolithus braarudii TaxID=221442 RepID=A0A7S0QBJ6_9EUKA|mmetsp:Transcript_9392/g.20486  ORF Transcript_9392/g.20486 Transcript_9392/m.20486 type:complete len:169 (+) Transcript_9392:268-774(+)